MKYYLIILSFLCIQPVFTQVVDLSNAKKERQITPKAYDGSFLKPDILTTDEQKAGLVGERITFVDISGYSIKSVKGGYAKDSDIEELKKGSPIITKYYPGEFSCKYEIKCNNKFWELESLSSCEWFLNKGFEFLKNKLVNKKFNSFIKGAKLESVDGSKFELNDVKPITITDVKFAKLSSYKHGLVAYFDNGKISEFEFLEFMFEEKYSWLRLSENYIDGIIVEVETLKKYSEKHKKFIASMRQGKIKIGMSERETRFAIGIPDTSYKIGSSKVNDYGYRKLYFKNGFLYSIK